MRKKNNLVGNESVELCTLNNVSARKASKSSIIEKEMGQSHVSDAGIFMAESLVGAMEKK
jgi:hypothetical protein